MLGLLRERQGQLRAPANLEPVLWIQWEEEEPPERAPYYDLGAQQV